MNIESGIQTEFRKILRILRVWERHGSTATHFVAKIAEKIEDWCNRKPVDLTGLDKYIWADLHGNQPLGAISAADQISAAMRDFFHYLEQLEGTQDPKCFRGHVRKILLPLPKM